MRSAQTAHRPQDGTRDGGLPWAALLLLLHILNSLRLCHSSLTGTLQASLAPFSVPLLWRLTTGHHSAFSSSVVMSLKTEIF